MILLAYGCAEEGPRGDPGAGPAAEVAALFAGSCATGGCHEGPERQTGLDLRPAVAWEQLLDVPATQAPSVARVAPGDPEGSYLLHKLTGTAGAVGGGGDVMPPGFGLGADEVARVEAWIADGAPSP